MTWPNTSRYSSAVTTGVSTVCTTTDMKRRTSFTNSVQAPRPLISGLMRTPRAALRSPMQRMGIVASRVGAGMTRDAFLDIATWEASCRLLDQADKDVFERRLARVHVLDANAGVAQQVEHVRDRMFLAL